MTEPDFVDAEIARRTARNPEFPKLLEEAMGSQEQELEPDDDHDDRLDNGSLPNS